MTTSIPTPTSPYQLLLDQINGKATQIENHHQYLSQQLLGLIQRVTALRTLEILRNPQASEKDYQKAFEPKLAEYAKDRKVYESLQNFLKTATETMRCYRATVTTLHRIFSELPKEEFAESYAEPRGYRDGEPCYRLITQALKQVSDPQLDALEGPVQTAFNDLTEKKNQLENLRQRIEACIIESSTLLEPLAKKARPLKGCFSHLPACLIHFSHQIYWRSFTPHLEAALHAHRATPTKKTN